MHEVGTMTIIEMLRLLDFIPIANASIYINVLILDYPSSILIIYLIWF